MRHLGMFVVVLLCLCLGAWRAECLRFELPSGVSKCIAEEIQTNVMVLGNYRVVAPGSDDSSQYHHYGTNSASTHPVPDDHKVTARVTSPYGNSMHHAENVESGQFAFTTSEVGDYLACFYIPPVQPPVKATIELEWKTGVFAKDWTKIAKRDKIDGMELELRKLEEYVNSVLDEMLYLREREEEMRNLNSSTNSRMAWFSIMSFFVCLSVAAWQLWHLKSFFERKKLL
uniref:TSA: Wollemia nobilis Ref_Wollemi_Transcript_22349_1087 transcribed RNA sequence n=1 Tax=Wollemia nobilis TaxID=56998 RepID=A0A0C9RQS0_9CONI